MQKEQYLSGTQNCKSMLVGSPSMPPLLHKHFLVLCVFAVSKTIFYLGFYFLFLCGSQFPVIPVTFVAFSCETTFSRTSVHSHCPRLSVSNLEPWRVYPSQLYTPLVRSPYRKHEKRACLGTTIRELLCRQRQLWRCSAGEGFFAFCVYICCYCFKFMYLCYRFIYQYIVVTFKFMYLF